MGMIMTPSVVYHNLALALALSLSLVLPNDRLCAPQVHFAIPQEIKELPTWVFVQKCILGVNQEVQPTLRRLHTIHEPRQLAFHALEPEVIHVELG